MLPTDLICLISVYMLENKLFISYRCSHDNVTAKVVNYFVLHVETDGLDNCTASILVFLVLILFPN